ncbi:hypothetical protein PoB_000805900 [Plakobranchus ocellatus]|uniref:Secreted protein n=1 Tax=Plakobranchus ocellatus TaxID=259542 RepID=A0AAV3YEZ6_9GAST|nr:hypothetical protein PoB_000805900 [Plakobranchus ocellatus]
MIRPVLLLALVAHHSLVYVEQRLLACLDILTCGNRKMREKTSQLLDLGITILKVRVKDNTRGGYMKHCNKGNGLVSIAIFGKHKNWTRNAFIILSLFQRTSAARFALYRTSSDGNKASKRSNWSKAATGTFHKARH